MGSYQTPSKKIKLIKMSDKTPVSRLQEFCAQEKCAPPSYEFKENENNSKVCFVTTLHVIAKGVGRSKIEAKHAACLEMINVLARMDKYKDKLTTTKLSSATTTTSPTSINAVGDLITLCLQRKWPVPLFDERAVSGEPHKRIFTFACRLGSKVYEANGSTKSDAKRAAAQEMLKQLSNLDQSQLKIDENGESADESTSEDSAIEIPRTLPVLELPSVEEVLAEYRRLRTPHLNPVKCALRIRPNFFLKLPPENKQNARNILLGNSIIYGTNKDRVDSICKALNLNYRINSIYCAERYNIFELVDCEYDCVIVGCGSALYDHVIDYFKNMLNLQKPSE